MGTMNKKAILLTLGITFVSLVVLSLASLVLKNAESSEERFLELASAERLYNIEKSVGKAIRVMVIDKVGLDLELQGANASYTKRFYNQTDTGFAEAAEAYSILKAIIDDRYSSNLDATKSVVGKEYGLFSVFRIPTVVTTLLPFPGVKYEYTTFPGNVIAVRYTPDVLNYTIIINSTVGSGTIIEDLTYACNSEGNDLCLPINFTSYGPEGVRVNSTTININFDALDQFALYNNQYHYTITNLSTGAPGYSLPGAIGLSGMKYNEGGTDKYAIVMTNCFSPTWCIGHFMPNTAEELDIQVIMHTNSISPLSIISTPSLRITLPYNEFSLVGRSILFQE